LNTINQRLGAWKESYFSRQNYSTMDRRPFYELAVPFLPKNKDRIIVDIGAGEGGFAKHLDLCGKYPNTYLLDGNIKTVQNLEGKCVRAMLYRAPEKLPFEDSSVGFIHCSHLVEHLSPSELYTFLKEINRVLIDEGRLIISAPMLWDCFYCDLSHVKPYYPSVFINYLCGETKQRSAEHISQDFTVQKLVYRYAVIDVGDMGAKNMVVDFVIQALKKAVQKTGFRKYQKNGFTLVLEKKSDTARVM
jgi:SAM-dependent methyltransferase